MRNTKSRNILMLVEGKKTEVKLFQKILSFGRGMVFG